MTVASVSSAVEAPPPPARGWPRERVVGHMLVGLWIVLGIGLVVYLTNAWNPALMEKYAPAYLSGLGVTVGLVAISVLTGAVLSVPVAYARMSGNRFLTAVAFGYVYFFRGTPLLAQAFLIYYGLGSFKP